MRPNTYISMIPCSTSPVCFSFCYSRFLPCVLSPEYLWGMVELIGTAYCWSSFRRTNSMIKCHITLQVHAYQWRDSRSILRLVITVIGYWSRKKMFYVSGCWRSWIYVSCNNLWSHERPYGCWNCSIGCKDGMMTQQSTFISSNYLISVF